MDIDKYLDDVLESQTLKDDSKEMKALRKRREEVETLLKEKFPDSKITIRYAGSKTKGTMILKSYDLDITCYFEHDDTKAGDSLEDIYNNVCKALQSKYIVDKKKSALRLIGKGGDIQGLNFHIDVIPGRFTDEKKGDVYLHQEGVEKSRLKTNPDVHVKHVQKSGVRDAIRLIKLWRELNGIEEAKTFILELLVIDTLHGKKDVTLKTQLKHVWTKFRDNSKSLSAKDPANEQGNDLSEFLDDAIKAWLQQVSDRTMQRVDDGDWESIFGKVESKEGSAAAGLAAAAAARPSEKSYQPWSDD